MQLRTTVLLGVILVSTGSTTRAQVTQRVSVDSNGAQANNTCPKFFFCISADGRYVAFDSDATNLVPGDTNGSTDVFVHDLQSGATTRVSVDSSGTPGNAPSYWPSLSADGRYVAFSSQATNLVPGDTNGFADIFVHDRRTGTTTLVSVDSTGAEGNRDSLFPWISADGRYVAFESDATNLVPGDTNGNTDVFVHDRQTGQTTRVSVDSSGVQGNSFSDTASISADGTRVAFESDSTNLVLGDTNNKIDIFVHDLQTGLTTRVNLSSAGAQANDNGETPVIAADGRHLAFRSKATNLVQGDTNGLLDVFVHDIQTGVTTRVSVDSSGGQGNGLSATPSLSSDGRFAAFFSDANNLVPGDTNAFRDVFVHDLMIGTTTRVSVDSAGTQGNNLSVSFPASISADGRYIAFESTATNLVPGDTNGFQDVFVRDQGAPPIVASCFGDGTGMQCPCLNNGLAGHGCENSSGTGGAQLLPSGIPRLSADSLVLTASGETPTALSVFFQGDALTAPVGFGDGLRCVGGTLFRLYVKGAVGGIVSAPQGPDPSVSTRSAALGDPIPLGATRHYQVYYRDNDPAFCSSPQGDTYNVANAVSAVWSP